MTVETAFVSIIEHLAPTLAGLAALWAILENRKQIKHNMAKQVDENARMLRVILRRLKEMEDEIKKHMEGHDA